MPLSSVTRRRFLTYSGVAAAGALAVGATQVSWLDLIHAADRDPLDPKSAVLVVVTLYGGNDGLNTVVPAGDKAYQSARPDLAYQPNEVLDLGDGLGLNPGMTGLHKLWTDKQLAIVRGVGYPQPDHSHFRSMAIWQTASPQTSVPTGWLGRWLDQTGDDPIRAVSIDPVLPPLLAGAKTAAASCPVAGLVLPPGVLGTSLSGLGVVLGRRRHLAGPGGEVLRRSRPRSEGARAGRAEGRRHQAARKERHADADRHPGSRRSGRRVRDGLVRGRDRRVGRPARRGREPGGGRRADTRLLGLLGGFDTHADERGTQQRLLGELDQALSAFAARLATTDRGKQVVTLVYSEFGRRVGANASEGTDHGTAGPVFVLGKGVLGGFHGAQPSMTDLDDGDLKAGTDFRDVYASVLQNVLGTDPGAVLDGHTGQVDKLFAA